MRNEIELFYIINALYRAVVINDYKLIKEAFAEPALSGRANFLEPLKARSGGIPRGLWILSLT
jgi:hypothetical protein